jgi:hypothetical protein
MKGISTELNTGCYEKKQLIIRKIQWRLLIWKEDNWAKSILYIAERWFRDPKSREKS